MSNDNGTGSHSAAPPVEPPPERTTESVEKALRASAQMQADPVHVISADAGTEVPRALAGPAPARDPGTSPAAADPGGSGAE